MPTIRVGVYNVRTSFSCRGTSICILIKNVNIIYVVNLIFFTENMIADAR